MVGTGFILVFFPVLILTLNDTKAWISKMWNGTPPIREEIEPAIIANRVSLDD